MMTPARIAKAVQRQRKMHRQAGGSRVVGDAEMHVSHNIDRELFYNGVVQSGSPECWNDSGYMRDMERLLPEIRVRPVSGKIMVGGSGLGTSMGTTRHGRPSVRIWYDKQGNRHEMRAAT